MLSFRCGLCCVFCVLCLFLLLPYNGILLSFLRCERLVWICKVREARLHMSWISRVSLNVPSTPRCSMTASILTITVSASSNFSWIMSVYLWIGITVCNSNTWVFADDILEKRLADPRVVCVKVHASNTIDTYGHAIGQHRVVVSFVWWAHHLCVR